MGARRCVVGAGIGACIALALSTSACGDSNQTTPPVSGTSPIVIGVMASLTGPLQSFGPPIQNGVRVAEGHINAVGGILGRPVKFVVVDDGSSTAVANEAVEKLLKEKPAAIIGPTGSNQAIEVHKRLAEASLLTISGSASTPTMTTAQAAGDRFFFRTAASHALQAHALGLVAVRGKAPLPAACKRAVVVHQNDDYGNTMATELGKFMTAQGGGITDIPVTAEQGSYVNEVKKAIAAKAECQVIIAFPKTGGQYLFDFRKETSLDTSRDWKTFGTIASNGLFQDEFVSKAKGGATSAGAEGVVGVFPESNPDVEEARDFRALYTSYFKLADGQPPPVYAANVFDAAILVALAIQAAGSVGDTIKIRDMLPQVSKGGQSFGLARLSEAINSLKLGNDIDYKGASGDCDFDQNGDVLSDYFVWKVENQKLVKYDVIRADEAK